MVELYSLLIIRGLKTFDQVPKKLQPKVRDYLYSLGLDENGNPLND